MRIFALVGVLAVSLAPIQALPAAADDARPASGSDASTPTLRQILTVAPTAAQRHSGTVVRISPDQRSITIAETVAWKGPGTGVVERTINLADSTDVQLVVRDPASVTRDNVPGFRETPLALSDLAPGDFVTVTTLPDRTMAIAIEVVRPSADTLSASPSTTPASPPAAAPARELPPRELPPAGAGPFPRR